MACICGHAKEDHEDEHGQCDGFDYIPDDQEEYPCGCEGYEEAGEE